LEKWMKWVYEDKNSSKPVESGDADIKMGKTSITDLSGPVKKDDVGNSYICENQESIRYSIRMLCRNNLAATRIQTTHMRLILNL
jgi:hypothetical protein